MGGLLGVIVAIYPLILQSPKVTDGFAIFLVFFVVTAILAYALLLFGEWRAYRADILVLSMPLSVLLTFGLASPLAVFLAVAGFNGNLAFAAYVVVVGIFFIALLLLL